MTAIEPLTDTLRARLEKIARLAESGVDGERDEARRLLERLCAKYGVEPETLFSQEKKWFRFAISSNRNKELFTQCACLVLHATEIRWRRSFKAVQVQMTEAEAIDVRACFRHYLDVYAEEEKTLFSAFIQKHGIFGPSSDDAPDEPMDAERLQRLLAMMRGMSSKNSWKKPAAKLTA